METTPPEIQLSTCSGIAYCDKIKMATAKVRWYNAKHTEGTCAFFQEKYYRVYVLLELLEMKVYVRIPRLSTCSLQVQQFLLPLLKSSVT